MKHPEIVQRILCGVAREQDFETIGVENALAIKRDSDHVHYRLCERGAKRTDDDGERTFEHYASTEHVDGMGDIIRVPGWDLIRMKTGRVPLLWSHDASPAPMGLVLRTRKDKTDDGVRALVTTSRVHEAEVYGDSEWGKHVETIVRLMERGDLPGVSVGFIPKRGRQPELEEREKLGMTVPWGMIFEEQELLELSVTSIPANGHAQQKRELDRFDAALREMVQKGEIAEAFAATLRESLVVSEERWAERIAKIGRTIVPLSKELPWARGATPEKDSPAVTLELGVSVLDKPELQAAVREAVRSEIGSVIREFFEPLEASILDLSEHLAASRDAAQAKPSERADDHVEHAPDGAPARTDASTGTSRNPTNPTPRKLAEEAFLRGIEAATSAARTPDDRSQGADR